MPKQIENVADTENAKDDRNAELIYFQDLAHKIGMATNLNWPQRRHNSDLCRSFGNFRDKYKVHEQAAYYNKFDIEVDEDSNTVYTTFNFWIAYECLAWLGECGLFRRSYVDPTFQQQMEQIKRTIQTSHNNVADHMFVHYTPSAPEVRSVGPEGILESGLLKFMTERREAEPRRAKWIQAYMFHAAANDAPQVTADHATYLQASIATDVDKAYSLLRITSQFLQGKDLPDHLGAWEPEEEPEAESGGTTQANSPETG